MIAASESGVIGFSTAVGALLERFRSVWATESQDMMREVSLELEILWIVSALVHSNMVLELVRDWW
jgi:hypothetical protein